MSDPGSVSTLEAYMYMWFLSCDVLCSIGPVVHKEKVDIRRVVDQECLVARWHHVAGFLVGSVTNLPSPSRQPLYSSCQMVIENLNSATRFLLRPSSHN